MKALKKLFFIFFSFSVHLSFASPLFKPFTSLFVVETEHLHIIYDEDSNNAVSRLVSSGDTVYSQVAELIGYSSQKKVPVVVTSDVELVNAYYMAFPKSKIVLYNSPMPESSLLVFSDPIVSIFRHELTHYIVAESRSPIFAKFANIFGSYVSITMGLNLPTFLAEGISVYSESQNGEGRLSDPFYLFEIYQAQIEDSVSDKRKFPSWKEISGARTDYNTGNLPYLYGANFIDFLLTSQKTSVSNLVSVAEKPHITFTSGTIKQATNESISEIWNEFSDSLKSDFLKNFENISEEERLLVFKKYKLKKPNIQSVVKNPSSKEIDFFCIESSTGYLYRITKENLEIDNLTKNNSKKNNSLKINKIKKVNSNFSSMSISPDGRFLAITKLISSGRFYKWETIFYDIEKEKFLELTIPSLQSCAIVSCNLERNEFEVFGTYSHDTKTFLQQYKVLVSSKNNKLQNECVLQKSCLLPNGYQLVTPVCTDNRVFAILVNGVKRSIIEINNVEINNLSFSNKKSLEQDFSFKTLFECPKGQSVKDLQIVSLEPLVLSASLAKTVYDFDESTLETASDKSNYVEVGFLTLNLTEKKTYILKNAISGGIRYPMIFDKSLIFFNSQLDSSDFIYKDDFISKFSFLEKPLVLDSTTETFAADKTFTDGTDFANDSTLAANKTFAVKKYNPFIEAFPGSLIPVPFVTSISSSNFYEFIEPGFYYYVQDPAALWSGLFSCHYNFPLKFVRQSYQVDFTFFPFDFSASFSDQPILDNSLKVVQRKTQGSVSFGDTWCFDSGLWSFFAEVSIAEAGYTAPKTVASLDSLYQAPYEIAKTTAATYCGFSNLRRNGTGFWDKKGFTVSLLGQMSLINDKGVFFEPNWSSQILVEQQTTLLPKSWFFYSPSWLTMYFPTKINLSAAITTDSFTPKESSAYWNHKMSSGDYCLDSKYNAVKGNLVFSSSAKVLLAGFDIQKPIPYFFLNTISLSGIAQECCFLNTNALADYTFLERLGLDLEFSIGKIVGYATGYPLSINCTAEYYPRSKKNYFSIFGMYIF